MLQACLNGRRTRSEAADVPLTAEELARDAAACVEAGAACLHVHPRDADGLETLEPSVIDEAVAAIREAVRVPVGVSTGAWMEADPERRASLVGAWSEPDYASVNLSEPGAVPVMHALLYAGIEIEAGLYRVSHAETLAAAGLGDRLERILIETSDLDEAAEIHAALDRLGLSAPRLQHGNDDGVWEALSDAVRRGLDTRIGLEDALVDPSGAPVGNVGLVRAARALGA
jgi:uncharacterized protein (DUF849 family)